MDANMAAEAETSSDDNKDHLQNLNSFKSIDNSI